MRLIPLLFLLAAALPAQGKDKAPLQLAPSSPWNVHYADDYCRLARNFGTGDAAVQILFDRFDPTDDFRLILAGKAMRSVDSPFPVQIRFGEAGANQRIDSWTANLGPDRPAWISGSGVRLIPLSDELIERRSKSEVPIELPDISEADEAAVRTILIERPLRAPIVLKTGSLGPPFAALRKCTDELLTHWGIDVERHRNPRNLPLPKTMPSSWLTSTDYPAAMIARGQPALVEFRLIVDETGAVKSCHIQQSTHPKDFPEVVCKVMMRRARFDPARDRDGKPMLSYYRNRVRFQI